MSAPQLIESFDGARLAVWASGPQHGPALVLSHYLGGSAEGWKPVAEALSDRFRVVRYDTRGHGASEAPPGPYDIAMLGRDVLAVIGALDLGRVHFAGVSQGGMAGMWLGVHHPEAVDRLVLANTTPFIPNKPVWDVNIARARAEGMDVIARETISGWLSETFKQRRPDAVAALIDTMRRMPVEGYAGACAVLRDVDLRQDLGRISSSTLVVAGADDGPRGAAAPVMASAVKDGRLVTIPDAAHLSHIENPTAFAAALMEHLG